MEGAGLSGAGERGLLWEVYKTPNPQKQQQHMLSSRDVKESTKSFVKRI